jgi:hypothetical protein
MASYSTEKLFLNKSWRIVGRKDTHTFLADGLGIRHTNEGTQVKFVWELGDFDNAVYVRGSGVPKVFRFKSATIQGTMSIPGEPKSTRAIELVELE